ncbi:MAG: ABC transporter permease [Dethiobacter sp.]|jgi:putative ABC transport system permease protein|nr:MAG: ABC transporter permease [Dethiobacter sp.]
MNLTVFYGAVILGLLYALMVLGVYLTFRILNFPDLTVDGSITLGAAVAASLIISGVNPVVATLVAPLAGALAGLVTGTLHTKFSIPPLLAGILTMIGLYSINLRIMGRPNLPLLRQPVIFEYVARTGLTMRNSEFILSLCVALLFIFILYYFLNTETGQALRATGDNEVMMRSLGVNTDRMKIVGLGISNALVALCGALVAQYQGFADISMGIGVIIAGLASVIVGEVLLGSSRIIVWLMAVVLGSVLYRLIIAVVLRLGFQPTDLKLFTAVIVTIALISPFIKSYLEKLRERYREKNKLKA